MSSTEHSCIWRLGSYLQTALAISGTVWKRVWDPVMIGMMGVIALVAFGLGFRTDSEGEVWVGMAIIHAFTCLVLIFIGSSEITRDVATKNAQFFLSKPLGRGGYIFGKYLGVLILGWIVFSFHAICFGVGLWVSGAPGKLVCFQTYVQLACMLVSLAGLLMVVSVVFAEIAATLFGVAAYILGFMVFLLPAMIKLFFPSWFQQVAMLSYYVLPSWRHYIWSIEGVSVLKFLTGLFAYSSAYATASLVIAYLWFSQKDLG